MNKQKVFVAGFVIMIILNGVLIFLLFTGPKGPPSNSRGEMKGRLIEKISTELALNAQQRKEYSILAKEHKKGIAQIDEKQKELIKSYFSFLSLDPINEEDKLAVQQKIEQYESDKIVLTYTHFEKLKSLCDEDQKVKFGLIVESISQVLIGTGTNNRPPPRRGQ